MIDHVLVPLDHSQLAETALRYAPHIVSKDGQVTLLSVVDDSMLDIDYGDEILTTVGGIIRRPEEPRPNIRQPAEDYLNQVVYRLEGPHLNVETLVQIGKPAEVIVDMATGLGVDAIVMSTHGRTGVTRWMYGSVTQKVLSAAPCPVFVIPSKMAASE